MSPEEKVALIKKGKKNGTLVIGDLKGTGFTKYTCPWCKKEKKPEPGQHYASTVRVSCYVEGQDAEVYVCPEPCYGEIVGGAKEDSFFKTMRTGRL